MRRSASSPVKKTVDNDILFRRSGGRKPKDLGNAPGTPAKGWSQSGIVSAAFITRFQLVPGIDLSCLTNSITTESQPDKSHINGKTNQ